MNVKDKILIRRIRIHTNRSGMKHRLNVQIGRSNRSNLVDLGNAGILPQFPRKNRATPMMKPDLYPLSKIREAIK